MFAGRRPGRPTSRPHLRAELSRSCLQVSRTRSRRWPATTFRLQLPGAAKLLGGPASRVWHVHWPIVFISRKARDVRSHLLTSPAHLLIAMGLIVDDDSVRQIGYFLLLMLRLETCLGCSEKKATYTIRTHHGSLSNDTVPLYQ